MQTRKFMMNVYGLTDQEATTIITQGVNFGMTQLVDGNWGVHSVIPKSIFEAGERTYAPTCFPVTPTSPPTPKPTGSEDVPGTTPIPLCTEITDPFQKCIPVEDG